MQPKKHNEQVFRSQISPSRIKRLQTWVRPSLKTKNPERKYSGMSHIHFARLGGISKERSNGKNAYLEETYHYHLPFLHDKIGRRVN